MAKSKKEAVNKSQAIRDALDANPDKSPSEIAEELKARGLDVNAQYVSTIKSNAKAKSRRTKIVRRGRAAHATDWAPLARRWTSFGKPEVWRRPSMRCRRSRRLG